MRARKGTLGSKTGEPRRAAPRSARGRRTRLALIQAARLVFERDGFVNVNVTDITKEAGVATGSFYTHFSSRDEIFAAVLAELEEEMLHPHLQKDDGRDDPIVALEAANRAYLLAYRRNARMNALMEQVAAMDDSFMNLRRHRAEAFVRRNASAIRKLQRDGVADSSLDATLTAHALSTMVSRMANRAFVEGKRVSFEKLVWTATRLWANALRIPTDD